MTYTRCTSRRSALQRSSCLKGAGEQSYFAGSWWNPNVKGGTLSHACQDLFCFMLTFTGNGMGRETEASSNLSLTLTGTCLAMLLILRALGARSL